MQLGLLVIAPAEVERITKTTANQIKKGNYNAHMVNFPLPLPPLVHTPFLTQNNGTKINSNLHPNAKQYIPAHNQTMTRNGNLNRNGNRNLNGNRNGNRNGNQNGNVTEKKRLRKTRKTRKTHM